MLLRLDVLLLRVETLLLRVEVLLLRVGIWYPLRELSVGTLTPLPLVPLREEVAVPARVEPIRLPGCLPPPVYVPLDAERRPELMLVMLRLRVPCPP